MCVLHVSSSTTFDLHMAFAFPFVGPGNEPAEILRIPCFGDIVKSTYSNASIDGTRKAV